MQADLDEGSTIQRVPMQRQRGPHLTGVICTCSRRCTGCCTSVRACQLQQGRGTAGVGHPSACQCKPAIRVSTAWHSKRSEEVKCSMELPGEVATPAKRKGCHT